jgi:ABC-type sugar transport system ATPase subunit
MACAVQEGQIELNGADITGLSPKARRAYGIGYIPSDRFKQAILPGFSLLDNYLLGNQFSAVYAPHGMIRHSFLARQAKKLMQEFDVRAVGENQTAGSLSAENSKSWCWPRGGKRHGYSCMPACARAYIGRSKRFIRYCWTCASGEKRFY